MLFVNDSCRVGWNFVYYMLLLIAQLGMAGGAMPLGVALSTSFGSTGGRRWRRCTLSPCRPLQQTSKRTRRVQPSCTSLSATRLVHAGATLYRHLNPCRSVFHAAGNYVYDKAEGPEPTALQALTMGRSGQATLGTFLQQLLLCLSQPDAAAWVLGLPNAAPPDVILKGATARVSRAATQQAGRKRGRDAEDIPASAAAASTDASAAAEPNGQGNGAQPPCQGPADSAAAAEAEPHGETIAEPAPTGATALAEEQPPDVLAVAEDMSRQAEAGEASTSGKVDVDDGRQPTFGQNHERARSEKKAKGDGSKKVSPLLVGDVLAGYIMAPTS